MKIKKGYFIELDYIGRIKEDGRVFDLTSEDAAKKEGLHNPKQSYGNKNSGNNIFEKIRHD